MKSRWASVACTLMLFVGMVGIDVGSASRAEAALVLATSTPTVNDTTPTVGQTLTVTPNTSAYAGWAPAPLTFSYQWYKCSTASPYLCTAVGTATTTKTHLVTVAEKGFRLKVKVTGSKAGYATVSKYSALTSAVLGKLTTTTPAVNDATPTVGQTLTVTPNTSAYAGWAPTPITFTYQWYRCSTASPYACTAVGTATTAKTLLVSSAEKGYRLKVKVTGRKSGYATVSSTSALTSAVLGKLTTTPPTLDDTTPQVDQTLTVYPNISTYAGWGPAPIKFTYQWYKCSTLSPYACTAVGAGTTTKTHKVTLAEKGYRLKVKVTGSKAGYAGVTSYTALTSPVANSALRTAIQSRYGTFAAFTRSGTGSTVVNLPAGVKAGIVTATHEGDSTFGIDTVDSGNNTLEMLVYTFGSYSGTKAFGLDLWDQPTKLTIEADGVWTLRVAPVTEAPVLILPVTATGPRVFLYSGSAANWRLSHKDGNYFYVEQYTTAADWKLLVGDFDGVYDGTVAALAGPGVLIVDADGTWTIARAPE